MATIGRLINEHDASEHRTGEGRAEATLYTDGEGAAGVRLVRAERVGLGGRPCGRPTREPAVPLAQAAM